MPEPLAVLLLEDRPADAALMVRALVKEGFDPRPTIVETEADYVAALDAVPDLIIADFALPQFDGLTALRLVKARGLDIPFVLVSGVIGEETAVQAMQEGAADYLLKDRLARLGPAVRRALADKRVRAERDLAERQKRAAEMRLANIVDHAAEAFVAIDSAQQVLFFNHAAEQMFGYTSAEVLGQPLDRLIPEGRAAAHTSRVQTYFARDNAEVPPSGHRELFARRKDGTAFPVEIGFSRIEVDDEHIGVAIISDITTRREAEQKLRESEARFRLLNGLISDFAYALQILPNGMPQGEWLTGAFQLTFGYTREEIDAHGGLFSIVHPEDLEVALAHYMRVRAGTPDVCEFRFVTREGDPRWIRDYARPEWDENQQKVIRIYGAAQDIHARKLAEEALAQERRLLRTVIDNLPDAVYAKDKDGRKVLANRADLENIGLPEAEVLGKRDRDVFPAALAERLEADDRRVMETGEPLLQREELLVNLQGQSRWLRTSKVPLRDAEGQIYGLVGIGRDITQDKRAAEALRRSEERFRVLFEQAADGIFVTDLQGRYREVNASGAAMLGYTREELLGMDYTQVLAPEELQAAPPDVTALARGDTIHRERTYRRKDGMRITIEITARMLGDGRIQNIVRDITARKRAEQVIRENELHLRIAVRGANLAVFRMDAQLRYTWMYNPQLGYTTDEVMGKNDAEILPPEDGRAVMEVKRRVIETGKGTRQEIAIHAGKETRYFDMILEPTPGAPGEPLELVGATLDITERKQAEQAIRDSERFGRDTLDALTAHLAVLDGDGTIVAVNRAWQSFAEANGGDPHTTGTGANYLQVCDASAARGEPAAAEMAAGIRTALGGGAPFEMDYACHGMGERRWFRARVSRFQSEGPPRVVVTHADITASTQAEQEIRARTGELAELFEFSRALAGADDLRRVPELIAQQAALGIRSTFASVLLVEGDALVVRAAYPIRVLDHDLGVGRRVPLAELELCPRVLAQNEVVLLSPGEMGTPVERAFLHLDFVESLCLVPLAIGGDNPEARYSVGLLVLGEARNAEREPFSPAKIRMARSIGDQAAVAIRRLSLKEETARRLQHLAALHMIDRAIGGSFDLRVILNIVLTQLATQVGVDAAAILLYNRYTQTLDYADGRGFQTSAMPGQQVRMGQALAGKVAMDLQVGYAAQAPGKEQGEDMAHWAAEGFVSAVGVPLVVKGKLKGVLEVFQREAFQPVPEWQDFLNTLAGQLAIAIETGELLENLQRSNLNLALAYEATIEGWSRALDLRDNETEGHTQRVTDMAVRLARRAGFDDAALVHMRRGALLHDIGKMGVPDDILRKRGELTPQEWEIMKKHPQFAYQLLEPIAFLKPALEIPYGHHERWDGSGYPRGLAGEAIPLAARVFAVVDVWDALTSDRTYRPAWSPADALTYIRAQAGKHFDPHIVELFLQEEKLGKG